jgi:hypothetical protein
MFNRSKEIVIASLEIWITIATEDADLGAESI